MPVVFVDSLLCLGRGADFFFFFFCEGWFPCFCRDFIPAANLLLKNCFGLLRICFRLGEFFSEGMELLQIFSSYHENLVAESDFTNANS